MASKGPVEFKGKLNGLYLNIDTNVSFDIALNHLKALLEERGDFYKGSKIIGINGAELNYKQKAAIEMLVFDAYGIEIDSLEEVKEISPKSTKLSNHTAENSESQVETKVETKIIEKIVEKIVEVQVPIPTQGETHMICDTHFVFGTMRSGKSVHFPGHVIVIGDINPGAEVVAEGNIIVMGRVLGFIHAGSAGNDKAVVIANLLKPTQIRISKYISVPPSDDETIHTTIPEKATVSNGFIKIEKCH